MNFEDLLKFTKDFMPSAIDIVKQKKKDASEMCEFTIKGNDEFVINALNLILG